MKQKKWQSYTLTLNVPAEWASEETASYLVRQLEHDGSGVTLKTLRRGGHRGEAVVMTHAVRL